MPNIIIPSPRLTLSFVLHEDLANIHELNSFPAVDQYNTLGLPSHISETEKIIEDRIKWNHEVPCNRYTFKICKTPNEFIGVTGIILGKPGYELAEIWYKIHPTYWGQGYATEVVESLVNFCFNTLHLHRVEAGVAIENIASIKVLEKCGFVREGHHRKLLPIRGNWVDNYSYAILKEDR